MLKYGALLDAAKQFVAMAEKIFGPYNQKGNGSRQIVIVIDDAGKKKTKTWARHLMEKHLGRELDSELETVDHKDGNFLNNDINNLQLLPRNEHSRQDTRRVKDIELTCDMCGEKFNRSPRLLRDKHNKGTTGVFCSRACSGKYNRLRQLKRLDDKPLQPYVESEYYKAKNVSALADYLLTKYALWKPSREKYMERLERNIYHLVEKYDWYMGMGGGANIDGRGHYEYCIIRAKNPHPTGFNEDQTVYHNHIDICQVRVFDDLSTAVLPDPEFPQEGLDAIKLAEEETYRSFMPSLRDTQPLPPDHSFDD